MNYFKTFAFMIILFQPLTFCSLQRTARTASRLASRSTMQSRCITNYRQLSTTTLAIYAATAFGAFKAFRYWDTIKARKEYAQRLAARKELQKQEEIRRVIQKVEKEKRQTQQREAQKKADQHMQKVYSEKLTHLYDVYRLQGKDSFLAQADTFAEVNDISIDYIKKSFLAQQETILKATEKTLKAMAESPNNTDQQKATKAVLTATVHIKNITEMAHALEQHQTQTNKKDE